MDDMITVLVPFSKEEVQVPRDIWKACQAMENRAAIIGLGVMGGVFGAGFVVKGMLEAGAFGFVLLGWLYFDGVLARRCAVRKVRGG